METAWLPFFYTSCEGGAGLQVHSRSSEITEDEGRDIYQGARYQMPAPNLRPTDEDIPTLPVRFGFLRLPSSGRYAVFRSQCVGMEYSGRWGNYLIEAYVYTGKYLPTTPVLYLNPSNFTDALAFRDRVAKEGAIDRPILLPPLQQASLQARPPVDSFLPELYQENGDLLIDMLHAAMSGKQLFVQATAADKLIPLVEALQARLPASMAHAITCSTYTREPDVDIPFTIQATNAPLEGYMMEEITAKEDAHIHLPGKPARGFHFPEYYIAARATNPDQAENLEMFLSDFAEVGLTPALDALIVAYRFICEPGSIFGDQHLTQALNTLATLDLTPLHEWLVGTVEDPQYLEVLMRAPTSLRKATFLPQLVGSSKGLSPCASKFGKYYVTTYLRLLSGDNPELLLKASDQILGLLPELASSFITDEYFAVIADEIPKAFQDQDSVTAPCLIALLQTHASLACAIPNVESSPPFRALTGVVVEALKRFAVPAQVTAPQCFASLEGRPLRNAWALVGQACKQTAHLEALSTSLNEYYETLPEDTAHEFLNQLASSGGEDLAAGILARSSRGGPEQLRTVLGTALKLTRIDAKVRREILESLIARISQHCTLTTLADITGRFQGELTREGLLPPIARAAATRCPITPDKANVAAIQQIYLVIKGANCEVPLVLELARTAIEAPYRRLAKTPNGVRQLVEKIESLLIPDSTWMDSKEFPIIDRYHTYSWELLDQLLLFCPPREVGEQVCLAQHKYFLEVYEAYAKDLTGKRVSKQEIHKLLQLTSGLCEGDVRTNSPFKGAAIEILQTVKPSILQQASKMQHDMLGKQILREAEKASVRREKLERDKGILGQVWKGATFVLKTVHLMTKKDER